MIKPGSRHLLASSADHGIVKTEVLILTMNLADVTLNNRNSPILWKFIFSKKLQQ
jgi:hypothetical protein